MKLYKMLKSELLPKAIGREKKVYATFIQRIVARLLDFIMLFCLLYLVSSLYKPFREEIKAVGFLIFYLIYYPLMEMNGGTVGKRIVGVRTISLSSELNISLEQIITRILYQIGPLIPLVFIRNFNIHQSGYQLLLGFGISFPYLMLIWAPQRQALHDIVSNAAVIKI